MSGETDIRCAPIPRRSAVLAYHKIGEPADGSYPTWNYVPVAAFVEHLSWLRDAGWQVIDLATFLRGLDEPELLPERSALITFDDGYHNTLTRGLPCLRQFGFPGVVFVPTAYVGGWNRFDEGIEPREAICSWDELRELQRSGIAVQSHGLTHRAFSTLDPDELHEEVTAAKFELENALKTSVATIAYPYGDSTNPCLDALLARAGFRAGFAYKGGCASIPADPIFRMPRIAMGPDSRLAELLGRDESASHRPGPKRS